MFYVYILQNKESELYTGYSSDLRRRFEEHNQGRSKSTKNRQWKLIYYEACMEEADARRRERYLKTTGGRRALRLRLREYFNKRRASRDFTGGI